jgi:hypothetical protein
MCPGSPPRWDSCSPRGGGGREISIGPISGQDLEMPLVPKVIGTVTKYIGVEHAYLAG